MAGAAVACALALAGAALALAAMPAAAAEGTPARRTIPVAPVDPDSTAGRIVFGIADKLEQWFGSGSDDLRLTLDAPMRAEEEGGTVTVHLPGVRLADRTGSVFDHALGDLAIAVTPRGATEYDFETALPPAIVRRSERLAIGESTVSGTWRSDLDTTTALAVTARNLRLVRSEGGAAVGTVSLGALTATDELAEGADGLWGGHAALSLLDLEGEGVTLGRLDIAGSFEGIDRDAILAMRRDLGPLSGDEGRIAALTFALAPLLGAQGGQSETTVTAQDLAVADGAFSLDRLVWHTVYDGRAALAALATRITAVELRFDADAIDELPSALIPHTATVDIAVDDLPLRRIAESLSLPAEPEQEAVLDLGAAVAAILSHMDAADTSIEVRDIHIAAPSFELRADGLFQVEPASAVGVIGRLNVRIGGFDALMALAAEEGDEGMMAFFILLQGLGRPVVEEGADEPVHAYEIDLRRDGAVTVNGIPFDLLLPGGLLLP